eukprot:403332827
MNSTKEDAEQSQIQQDLSNPAGNLIANSSDVRQRSLSNHNDIQIKSTSSFNGLDDTFLSHRRRKMIDHKNNNHDEVISNRSLSRTNKRASSRHSSNQSSKSYSETHQNTLQNRANSPGLSNKSEYDIPQLTGKTNTKPQNTIEEQDLEETIGDEQVMKQQLRKINLDSGDLLIQEDTKVEQNGQNDQALKDEIIEFFKDQKAETKQEPQKQVITFNMLQSLQNSKTVTLILKPQTQNEEVQNVKQETVENKPLSESWEKSIKDQSQSFVSDLFSKFNPLGFGSSNSFSPPQVTSTSAYNRRVTLIMKPNIQEQNQKSDNFDTQNAPIENKISMEKSQQQITSTTTQNQIQKENFLKQDEYEDQLNENSGSFQQYIQVNEGSNALDLFGQENNQNEYGQKAISQKQSLGLSNLETGNFIQETLSLVDIQNNFKANSTLNVTDQLDPQSIRKHVKPQQSEKLVDNLLHQSLNFNSGKKNQNNQLLEMSFNNHESSSKLKNQSNYIDVSFQGSNSNILNNKQSELMDILTPSSNDGMIGGDFDNYSQVKDLTQDTLDLLFYYITKEEIKSSIQKIEKETEDQVLKVSVYRTEDAVIDSILTTHIEDLKQDMYQKFLDNIINQAQDKVIERIMGEFILLIDLGTPENAAEFLADELEQKLMSRLVDFLDQEEPIQSERLKLASDAIYLRQVMNYQEDYQDYLGNDNVDQQEMQLSKKKRKFKTSKSPEKQRFNNSNSQIDGLLDLEFFEKCFFGKRLHIKDQIIFKIYAKELLEIIQHNFTGATQRKYKQLLLAGQKRQKSRQKSKIKNRHRSPSPFQVNVQYNQTQNATQMPKYRKSLTPTNDQMRGLNNLLLVQDYYKTVNNLRNGTMGQQYTLEGPASSDPISINIIEQRVDNTQDPNALIYQQNEDNQKYKTIQLPSEIHSNQIEMPVSYQSSNVPSSNDQSQIESQQHSVRSRKKRQPSQIKRPSLESTKPLAQPKSPPRQQQVKILQNLESQMKEILRNDKTQRSNGGLNSSNFSGSVRQIKLKKRNAVTNTLSLQSSPARAVNTSNLRNQLMSFNNNSKDLPSVKRINRYKLSTQNNSMIMDQNDRAQNITLNQIQQQNIEGGDLNYKDSKLYNVIKVAQNSNAAFQQKNKHAYIDNYLLSSVGSHEIGAPTINIDNSKNQKVVGFYPDQTGEFARIASGSQKRASSIQQNVQFAPLQIRSISVANRAMDAAQVLKKYKAKKKVKQDFDLSSTNAAALDMQRPKSKGRFLVQRLKDLNKTFNSILKTSSANAANRSLARERSNEIPLNSDRYKQQQNLNDTQNVEILDYQTNYESLKNSSGLDSSQGQRQLQNNGQSILKTVTIKNAKLKITAVNSFLDRTHLSGQTQLMSFDQNSGKQVKIHNEQMKLNQTQQLSSIQDLVQKKHEIPELKIQQKVAPLAFTINNTPQHSMYPLQQNLSGDLHINSDRIKRTLSKSKKHNTDLSLNSDYISQKNHGDPKLQSKNSINNSSYSKVGSRLQEARIQDLALQQNNMQ